MSQTLLKSLGVLAVVVVLSFVGLTLMNLNAMLSPPDALSEQAKLLWWMEQALSLIMKLMFVTAVSAAMISLYATSQKGVTAPLTTRSIYIAGLMLCLCGAAGMFQSALQMPHHQADFDMLQAAGHSGLGYGIGLFLSAIAGNGHMLLIGFVLIFLSRQLCLRQAEEAGVASDASEDMAMPDLAA